MNFSALKKMFAAIDAGNADEAIRIARSKLRCNEAIVYAIGSGKEEIARAFIERDCYASSIVQALIEIDRFDLIWPKVKERMDYFMRLAIHNKDHKFVHQVLKRDFLNVLMWHDLVHDEWIAELGVVLQYVDINDQNPQFLTAAMVAAKNNAPNALKLILEYEPDLSIKDKKGYTALDHAIESESLPCQRLLRHAQTKSKASWFG